MITAVDTNIFLDLLIPGSRHLSYSRGQLKKANEAGSIIICEIVYAELMAQFPSPPEYNQFIRDTGIILVNSDEETLQIAAKGWKDYTQKRDTRLQCPNCGYENNYLCPKCAAVLTSRQHIVSDFIIGAHALVQADGLFTRDRGYYGKYFPDLKLDVNY